MSMASPLDATLRASKSPFYRRPPDLRPSRWKFWSSIVLGLLGVGVIVVAIVFFVPKPQSLDAARADSIAELDALTASVSGEVTDTASTASCGDGLERAVTERTIAGSFDPAEVRADLDAYAQQRDWLVQEDGQMLRISSTSLLDYRIDMTEDAVTVATASTCVAAA